MKGTLSDRIFHQCEDGKTSFTKLTNSAYETMFLVAYGDSEDTDALVDTLDRVAQTLETEGFDGKAIVLNVFLAQEINRDVTLYKIRKCFGVDFPATTLIFQPPSEDRPVALELIAIRKIDETSPKKFKLKRPYENTVLLETDRFLLLNVGGLYPDFAPIGAYHRSLQTFAKMRLALENSGFSMNQILRTWIYQGHLTLEEGSTQRYKELNRSRTDFFEKCDFLKPFLPRYYNGPRVFPASTGIGDSGYDVSMSCVAISSVQKGRIDKKVITVPLENPLQTPAFDYGEQYSPQSPKFSRAMALSVDRFCVVFVSGTASITSQETRHFDDPAAQTEQTLDNIEALISGNNLAKHAVPGFEADISDMASLRVYVKRPSEYELIRKVCEERCRNIPILYTFADVCRDDLLVEIEGVAFPRSIL